MERNGRVLELFQRTNPTPQGLLEKITVPQIGAFNKFRISKLGKLPSPNPYK